MTPSDPEDEDAVLSLPNISSLERFARTQDPSWRQLLTTQPSSSSSRHASNQPAGAAHITQLLNTWASSHPSLTDGLEEGTLLAALHLLQDQRPSPLLTALTRVEACCANLVHAQQQQLSSSEGWRDPEVMQLIRPLLVIVFLCTQCLLLPPHASGTTKKGQPQQQQQEQTMQEAALQALSKCCSFARSLCSHNPAQHLHILDTVGQRVQAVVLHEMMHGGKHGGRRKQLDGTAALLSTQAPKPASPAPHDAQQLGGDEDVAVRCEQGSLQFFSGLAKDVCSACTSSGSSSHGAATGAAFLSEVLLSAAHIEGTQGLRLILALTEALALSSGKAASSEGGLLALQGQESDVAVQALASTLSTAQDPLAAGLVLRALLPALWECPRAGMRKSLLDCAGACFGGGEAPTELASYAAAALSQGANDRDATVRARALSCFASCTNHVWQHDLLSSTSIIVKAIAPTLCCRMLDTVKTVRAKALLVLSSVLEFQPREEIGADTHSTEAPGMEEMMDAKLASIKQEVALTAFPAICALLDARQDSQLYDEGCQQAAEDVLEQIGRALGDKVMLSLVLQLLPGACPRSTDRQAAPESVHSGTVPETAAAAAVSVSAAAKQRYDQQPPQQNKHNSHQQPQQQGADAVLPRTHASPMLAAVLLARFVPQSAAVAYAAWAEHVQGMQGKAQMAELSTAMQAVPPSARRTLYQEAFRVLCTTLGQQQQQQDSRSAAARAVESAAKLIFCLGGCTADAEDQRTQHTGGAKLSKLNQPDQGPDHHQQQQDALGEVAVLADAISFCLEAAFLRTSDPQPASHTQPHAQQLLAACWCLRALQSVLSQLQARTATATSPTHNATAAQNATATLHTSANKVALKLGVQCLPGLLQLMCVCSSMGAGSVGDTAVGVEEGSDPAAPSQQAAAPSSEAAQAQPPAQAAPSLQAAASTAAVPSITAASLSATTSVLDEVLHLLCSCKGGSLHAHRLLITLEAKLRKAAATGCDRLVDSSAAAATECDLSSGKGVNAAGAGAVIVAVEQMTSDSAMAVLIMLLGHMCMLYESEREEFLARAQAARRGQQAELGKASVPASKTAAGAAPAAVNTQDVNTQHRAGLERRERHAQNGAEGMEIDGAVQQSGLRGMSDGQKAGSGGQRSGGEGRASSLEELLMGSRKSGEGPQRSGDQKSGDRRSGGMEELLLGSKSGDLKIDGLGSGGQKMSGEGAAHHMQQTEEMRVLQGLAQQYVEGLMQRTAPATYTSTLLAVITSEGHSFSCFLKVRAVKALARLMLLSDTQAQLHGPVLGQCLQGPLAQSRVQTSAGAEALCCAALEAAEQLLIRSPNANSQLLPHVESLVAGLLMQQANQPIAGRPSLLVRAMVCFARIVASDKLQLSGRCWQILAHCALCANTTVCAIAEHTLRALLLGYSPTTTKKRTATVSTTAQARLLKGVFALYGNCDAGLRKQLVEQVLLGWPLLSEPDLASDALVLPLLQSLTVADCRASRAAALTLMAHTPPSAKALATLHLHLHDLGIPHLSTDEARAVLSGLKAFVSQHGTANKRTVQAQAAAQQRGDVSVLDEGEGRQDLSSGVPVSGANAGQGPGQSGVGNGGFAVPVEVRGLKAKLLGELEAMAVSLKQGGKQRGSSSSGQQQTAEGTPAPKRGSSSAVSIGAGNQSGSRPSSRPTSSNITTPQRATGGHPPNTTPSITLRPVSHRMCALPLSPSAMEVDGEEGDNEEDDAHVLQQQQAALQSFKNQQQQQQAAHAHQQPTSSHAQQHSNGSPSSSVRGTASTSSAKSGLRAAPATAAQAGRGQQGKVFKRASSARLGHTTSAQQPAGDQGSSRGRGRKGASGTRQGRVQKE